MIPAIINILNFDLRKIEKRNPSQVFFQDFLLGPFLQRRLSLAEQLGWLHPPPPTGGLTLVLDKCSSVETECVKNSIQD